MQPKQKQQSPTQQQKLLKQRQLLEQQQQQKLEQYVQEDVKLSLLYIYIEVKEMLPPRSSLLQNGEETHGKMF